MQLVDVELAKSLAQIQALALEQNAIPKDKVIIIRSYMEFAVKVCKAFTKGCKNRTDHHRGPRT